MEIVNNCTINGMDESGDYYEEAKAVSVPTYRKYTIGIDEAARREQEKLAGKAKDSQKLFNAV